MVNKSDLIKEYAKRHEVTMSYARQIFETVFELVGEHIVNEGDDVYIHRFGTFRHKHTKEHLVKHPATGEMVMAESKDKIFFVPAVAWSGESSELEEEMED